MNNKQSGFTLVEIMIVVAIIALLAAIAVPNFLRARVRSQATSMINDFRMISSAAEQYAIENGLAGTATVEWDSITQYFKSGSKIANGQSAVTLTGTLVYDSYFTGANAISPTAQLTVPEDFRDLFTPTISTDDSLWTN